MGGSVDYSQSIHFAASGSAQSERFRVGRPFHEQRRNESRRDLAQCVHSKVERCRQDWTRRHIFIVANPDWGMATDLVPVFDRIADTICGIVHSRPISQKATLAFHVTAGTIDFKAKTASLVNSDLLVGSVFCGVSLHREDGALIIDKSLKYPNAAFVRIERVHSGDAVFSEAATSLYDDEIAALRLLGIEGIT
jgi:hypothetical protein